jgi:hypothetical protein
VGFDQAPAQPDQFNLEHLFQSGGQLAAAHRVCHLPVQQQAKAGQFGFGKVEPIRRIA